MTKHGCEANGIHRKKLITKAFTRVIFFSFGLRANTTKRDWMRISIVWVELKNVFKTAINLVTNKLNGGVGLLKYIIYNKIKNLENKRTLKYDF